MIKYLSVLMAILFFNCGGSKGVYNTIAVGKFSTASVEKKQWKRTFEEGETRHGTPEELTTGAGNHNTIECGVDNFIPNKVGVAGPTFDLAKKGNRSFVVTVKQLDEHPCLNNEKYTLRHYPTWDGRFKLPVLVMFWLYSDVFDWPSLTGNRFSPLTVKGRFPKAPDDQIMTTHILPDGTAEIKHATEIFKNPVPIPLNKWNLHALYIENGNNITTAFLYSDGEIVHIARADGFWGDGELRRWHMGVYGVNNGSKNGNTFPSTEFSFYNDEIQVIEVNNQLEAENIMLEELDGSVDTTAPSAPINVRIEK